MAIAVMYTIVLNDIKRRRGLSGEECEVELSSHYQALNL